MLIKEIIAETFGDASVGIFQERLNLNSGGGDFLLDTETLPDGYEDAHLIEIKKKMEDLANLLFGESVKVFFVSGDGKEIHFTGSGVRYEISEPEDL